MYFSFAAKPFYEAPPLAFNSSDTVKSPFVVAATLLLLALIPTRTRAQAGTLDLSFDTDGLVTTPVGTAEDRAQAVAVQPDGRIVVAGARYQGFTFDFAVLRYTPTGALDNTFGSGGIVTTDFGTNDDYARAIALQPDGKIVVAGYGGIGTVYNFVVARYDPTGTLDPTFGTGGKVTTAVGSFGSLGQAVAIQPDGKIVVAGYSEVNGLNQTDFALVRYNANGTLDMSFDTDGKLTTDFGTIFDYASSVALQPDGKIVVAGERRTDALDIDFAVARYNPNGSLDTTFDTDGKVITAFGPTNDQAFAVMVQPDGKLIAAGFSFLAPTGNFAVARYLPNGSLDPAFDTDGKVTTSFGAGFAGVWGAALQPNGKIVVAGYVLTANQEVALARYLPNGSLDPGFGTAGLVTTAISPRDDVANAVALQPDGKIVVAGTTDANANLDIALGRYHGDGPMALPKASAWLGAAVAPNPFTDELVIAAPPEAGEVALYDALGRCVARLPLAAGATTRLRTAQLPAGSYLLRYAAANRPGATMKLVKL